MEIRRFKTIAEFYRFRELPSPEHPLISIINVEDVKHLHVDEPMGLVFDFYSIALKRSSNLRVQYGQHTFDFNEGVMSFVAPNQVVSISVKDYKKKINQSGWVLYIHPDFLWTTALAKSIKRYEFWDYSLHECLFLSSKEEQSIASIARTIRQEYQSNIDRFSKNIIVSHIETLLKYAERYYYRQFMTREKINHQILDRLEIVLAAYFNGVDPVSKGLPTVAYLAKELNISAKYLSTLLKIMTGLNTQQHIHEKLIAQAKEKLSTTNLSIGEIAFELGFEHLQSFSKLFRIKTKQSPLDFRASLN